MCVCVYVCVCVCVCTCVCVCVCTCVCVCVRVCVGGLAARAHFWGLWHHTKLHRIHTRPASHSLGASECGEDEGSHRAVGSLM